MSILSKLFNWNKPEKADLMETKAMQATLLNSQLEAYSSKLTPIWQTHRDELYRVSEDFYSVAKLIINAASAIPIYGYDTRGGEDLPETDPLVIFLKTLTTKERFKMCLYFLYKGECFIFKDKIDFGPNAGKIRLHYLHPEQMTVVLEESFPHDILGYKRTDEKGDKQTFDREEIIFISNFAPSKDPQKNVRGLAAETLLRRVVGTIKAGQNTIMAQLQNGGVPGIIYDKRADFSAEQHGLRQTKYAEFSNNPSNKGAPYMAVGEMGYLPLGLSLVDLDVSELKKLDLKTIANVLGPVSDRLLNNDATGSEVSDKGARKGLYINAVNPMLALFQDAFNNELVPQFGEGKEVRFDYSSVEELQENMSDRIAALAASPTMKPNDVREALGYDRSDDPKMDLDWIKSGYQPITDFEEIDPLDEPLLDA